MPSRVLPVSCCHTIWGLPVSLLCPLPASWRREACSWRPAVHVLAEEPAATESHGEDGTNAAFPLPACLLVLMPPGRQGSGAGQACRDSFSNVTKLKIAFGSTASVEHLKQVGIFHKVVISSWDSRAHC